MESCPHGDPFPGSISEMHEIALDGILDLIQKYDEQGRSDVGYKAARKFASTQSDLVDTFLVAFLASTGTRAILYNEKNKDTQNKPFVFHVAQVISAFEKRLYGSASAANVENENIITFYKMRIPCSCLDGIVEEPDEEEFGTCGAEGCGACRPLSELSACAGCRSVVYCDAICQRKHWPKHAPVCCLLRERQKDEGEETSVTDLETSEQFSIYSAASGRSGKSGRSGRSHSSDKSGKSHKSRKSRPRQQKLDPAPRSPTRSPKRSARRLPHSPRKTPDSPRKAPDSPTKSPLSSPKAVSRRKFLTKEDSKKKRKVRKSMSSSDEPGEEKKHRHSKTKKKSLKLGASSGDLSAEKKERTKIKKSTSPQEKHEKEKERSKSKTRSKSRSRSSSRKSRSHSRDKRRSKTKKDDIEKVQEERVQ